MENRTEALKEKIIYEAISYLPGVQTTNDLEAATKTIIATAEAVGLGSADYSSALTLPIPTDLRLAIIRIGTRKSLTIDSLNAGCTTLRFRVYVDVQDANHLLFDNTETSTGNKLGVQDCLVGTKETIFNLLKDGNAHTFYLFFWVDAGNAVISLVQLWEGVGTSIVGAGTLIALLTYTGMLSGFLSCGRTGTGTNNDRITLSTLPYYYQAGGTEFGILLIAGKNFGIASNSSVATDISCLSAFNVVLRSN